MVVFSDEPAKQAWFIGDFVPEILALVLDTWARLRRTQRIEFEQRLTNLFCDALERAYEDKGKRWFIVPDMKRTDPETGKEVARHDIRFFHRDLGGQRIYFIFECKKLNVVNRKGRTSSNSSSYSAGMAKFVNEEYGADHPCGGMIGYVMNGSLSSALESIKRNILKRSVLLRIAPGGDYASSSLMPREKRVGETKHQRASGDFVIYHVLLPLRRP